MKRRKRESAPQGRYAVEYGLDESGKGFAYVWLIRKQAGPGLTIRDIALGRRRPRATEEEPLSAFPDHVREALGRKAGGNLPEHVIADLEHALSAPVLKRPTNISTARRMLARKYEALVSHLGKVREILSEHALFYGSADLDLYTTQVTLEELMTEAEKRRTAVSVCRETGEWFKGWEELRRNRVAGTVLSVLEASGVPSGGPRGGRIMDIVMNHFLERGRALDDSKSAVARYRRWWNGLGSAERDALLKRVRLGVPSS